MKWIVFGDVNNGRRQIGQIAGFKYCRDFVERTAIGRKVSRDHVVFDVIAAGKGFS